VSDLEPIPPAEAAEMYHHAKRDGHAEATRRSSKHRIGAFLQFCEEHAIDNPNELSGRDLFQYRIWRREGQGEGREPIKLVTLKGQLATLRTFLKFAANIDAVAPSLYEQVALPTMKHGADVSDSTLEPGRAVDVLESLERAHPASRDHIIMLLLWCTGARTGAIRGLDLADLALEGEHPEVKGPAIRFVHRPETDTPLRNQEDGTRWNRISELTAKYLTDYLELHRHDVTDDHGRNPAITTTHGRPAGNTIRKVLYRITRPCWRGEDCPHDRDVDTCDGAHLDHARKCPSSRSPARRPEWTGDVLPKRGRSAASRSGSTQRE